MRAPGQKQHGYILGAGLGFGRVECRLTHLRLRAPLTASKDLARSYAVAAIAAPFAQSTLRPPQREYTSGVPWLKQWPSASSGSADCTMANDGIVAGAAAGGRRLARQEPGLERGGRDEEHDG